MKSFILGLLIVFAWRAAGAQTYAQAPPRLDAAPKVSQVEKVEKAKKKAPVSDPTKDKEKVPVTEPPPRPIPEVEPHVPGQTPPPPPGSPPPHSM